MTELRLKSAPAERPGRRRTQEDGMNERMREVVLALAGNDMVMERAAREIYLSRSTVEYHTRQIRERTGLDPRRFYDLQKLVEMARGDGAGP